MPLVGRKSATGKGEREEKKKRGKKKPQEPRREERRGEGGAGEGKREAARTHHHLHRCQPNFFPPLSFFFFLKETFSCSHKHCSCLKNSRDRPTRCSPAPAPAREGIFPSPPPPALPKKKKERERSLWSSVRLLPFVREGGKERGSAAAVAPRYLRRTLLGLGCLRRDMPGGWAAGGGARGRTGEEQRGGWWCAGCVWSAHGREPQSCSGKRNQNGVSVDVCKVHQLRANFPSSAPPRYSGRRQEPAAPCAELGFWVGLFVCFLRKLSSLRVSGLCGGHSSSRLAEPEGREIQRDPAHQQRNRRSK